MTPAGNACSYDLCWAEEVRGPCLCLVTTTTDDQGEHDQAGYCLYSRANVLKIELVSRDLKMRLPLRRVKPAYAYQSVAECFEGTYVPSCVKHKQIPTWAGRDDELSKPEMAERLAARTAVEAKLPGPALLAKPDEELRREVESRGIVEVVHFTRLTNLASILTYGLVPRAWIHLLRPRTEPVLNDRHRLDGEPRANCLSVSSPNYRLFWRLRQDEGGGEDYWVVLSLHSQILWTRRCAFCVTNAADRIVTNTPLARRCGVAAFRSMFEDYAPPGCAPEDVVRREALVLSSGSTTSPQAEVLGFDRIEPNLIRVVYCENAPGVQLAQSAAEAAGADASTQILCRPDMFHARTDHAFWTSYAARKKS